MKQVILILIFILTTTLPCFGEKEHLEPVIDAGQYGDVLKEYYDNVFTFLYRGFTQKPYARYTSMPSFSSEYAYSVEKIDKKYYVVSIRISDSYWYSGFMNKRDSIETNITKAEISYDLYTKIGELFEFLVEQIKPPNKIGLDGTMYYFSTTDKKGEIRTGQIWSPYEKSLLGRLVKICDNLYAIGLGKDISQSKILKEINILITDLKQ